MTTGTFAPKALDNETKNSARHDRLLVMDALRFLSAVAIIWLHTDYYQRVKPTMGISRFAVPFFTVAAVYFIIDGLRGNPSRKFGPYAIARVKRIYIPFLIWTAVYVVARELKHAVFHVGEIVSYGPQMLWVGSAHHLWFLPFLFVVSLGTFIIGKAVLANPSMEMPAAIAAFVGGIVLSVYSLPAWMEFRHVPGSADATKYIVGLGIDALPAAAVGLALSLAFQGQLLRRMRSTLVGVIAGLTLIVLMVISCFVGRNRPVENAAGLAAFVLGFAPWGGVVIRRMATLAPYAYGIYLIHVLYEECILAAMNRVHIVPGLVPHLVLFGSTAVLAVISAVLLSSRPVKNLFSRKVLAES